jgi:peptidoglycan/xylan/chitin deacetylase (PgdA/CDA1 family)
MSGEPRLASVSLDVDDLWSYLKTHGNDSWSSRPSYLDRFVPLVLETMDRLKVKSTFFLVGVDAERHVGDGLLKAMVDSGHTVGNHSHEHEPWLHLYSDQQIAAEIGRAEDAITAATGQRPRGFRGPGYSWSPALLEVIASRGYRYDSSTLPTFLGPLARTYYFWTAKLSKEERERRRALFGTLSEGFRPNGPYRWQLAGGASILEIPVTVMPLVRTPFHLSYLLYLSRWSEGLMTLYLRAALRSCRLAGIEPTFLLHPLDLLGGDEVPQLAFFPGMEISTAKKIQLFTRAIAILREHYTLVDLEAHAARIIERGSLRLVTPARALPHTVAAVS